MRPLKQIGPCRWPTSPSSVLLGCPPALFHSRLGKTYDAILDQAPQVLQRRFELFVIFDRDSPDHLVRRLDVPEPSLNDFVKLVVGCDLGIIPP